MVKKINEGHENIMEHGKGAFFLESIMFFLEAVD